MPIISDSANASYAWVPIAILGLVPNAVSQDADSLRQKEQNSFDHLSQTLETTTELFSSLTKLRQSFSTIPPEMIGALQTSLEKIFGITSGDELNVFLNEHYDLALKLFQIHDGIKKYFPGKLSLRVLPAGDDASSPQLVLDVHTHLSSVDARKSMADFRSQWWRPNYAPCFKDLTVSLLFA